MLVQFFNLLTSAVGLIVCEPILMFCLPVKYEFVTEFVWNTTSDYRSLLKCETNRFIYKDQLFIDRDTNVISYQQLMINTEIHYPQLMFYQPSTTYFSQLIIKLFILSS